MVVFFFFPHATWPQILTKVVACPWEPRAVIYTVSPHPGSADCMVSLYQRSPIFLAPGTSFMEDSFSKDKCEGWFWDISSALYLQCTLFFLPLHQLHLRSSGIRSKRLGTPALRSLRIRTWCGWYHSHFFRLRIWTLKMLKQKKKVLPVWEWQINAVEYDLSHNQIMWTKSSNFITVVYRSFPLHHAF